MVLCSVAGCRAYYHIKSIKTDDDEQLSFFHLPRDPYLRTEWIRRCGMQDPYNLKYARVCSLHFRKSDFDSSYLTKCAFGLKPLRPRLHKDAVPSLRLPGSGLDGLLEEYAGEDYNSDAAHAACGEATPPMDPEDRAAIIEEAIADMLHREQRQYDENLELLSSISKPKKTPAERAAAKKRKLALKNLPASGTNVTSMKSEVFLLPKGGPVIRKVTFMKPEQEANAEEEEDLDDLGRQLKEIRRLQRQTGALEQKLAAKQRLLREVLLQQAAARAALTAFSERKRGRRRKRVDVDTDLMDVFSAGDPLMVLRSEEEPSKPAAAGDMLSVPADLAEAKRIIFGLRQEVMALRNSTLKHAITTTVQRMDYIGKEVKRDVRHAAVIKRLRDALSSVFSPAQQSRVLKGKKILPWESEDYMHAIALRRMCRRRTFEFVRNTMKIPLPSMFALRSAAAFGRFPEVTRGFKELREQKRLRFNTGSGRAYDEELRPEQYQLGEEQSATELEPLETEVVATVDLDDPMALQQLEPMEEEQQQEPPPRRRVGRGRGGRGRGGARVARKRQWRPEEEEEEEAEQEEVQLVEEVVDMETASPQKHSWNAVDLTELIEFEQREEHGASIDDAWSQHVQSSLGVLSPPRGRGRGRGMNRPRSARPLPPGGGKRAPSQLPSSLTFVHEL